MEGAAGKSKKREGEGSESVVVTGDRYLDCLVKFVEAHTWELLLLEDDEERLGEDHHHRDDDEEEGYRNEVACAREKRERRRRGLTLKLNPVGLHYVQLRLDALKELEGRAPVDYLRAYVSDLGDHRALEQLRRILRLLPSLKVFSLLPHPLRDPTPLSLLSFSTLRVLQLRGCDLSTSELRGGLLHLTHCLHKFICHNSTDALRHVFASRVVDIKDSLVWKRLSFVSCACNNLLVMDESLQLLPAVENLDLSRNRFTKMDNLNKCIKLRNLDLGFNHLTNVASLREAPCPIVKLILRNNALTSLHGIETLKTLEGLDISYNIISKFSDLELLSTLPCLKSLWLEGNPISCAHWYRAHVFSFFLQSDKLELDGKGIGMREYLEMKAILARRQRKPTGYGFYFPAKDANPGNGFAKRKKKHFRLASIDEEQRLLDPDAFDGESPSCNSEHLRKDDNATSDSEVDAVDLMNKIEEMKKEKSALWLREFKEWLDQTQDDSSDASTQNELDSNQRRPPYPSVSSREDGRDPLELHDIRSEMSAGVLPLPIGDKGTDAYGKGESSALCCRNPHAMLRDRHVNSNKHEPGACSNGLSKFVQVEPSGSFSCSATISSGRDMEQESYLDPLVSIEGVVGSSSAHSPRSPPHYADHILQTCHNSEDDLSQISTESCSVESSESDTSCSGDGSCKIRNFVSGINLLDEDCSSQSISSSSSLSGENDGMELDPTDNVMERNSENDETDQLFKESSKKMARKPKRNVISLSPDDSGIDNNFLFRK